MTALHSAARCGNLEAINVLFEAAAASDLEAVTRAQHGPESSTIDAGNAITKCAS